MKSILKLKNKLILAFVILLGLFLVICFVIPFLQEKFLYWRFRNINISHLLIRDGELPSEFSAGETIDIEPHYYKSARAKEQEILASDSTKVGSVSAFLFASAGEQDKMFSIYSQVESQEGIIPYEVSGIGDCESCTPIFSINGCDIEIVFTRCAAVGVFDLYAACVQKEYDFDFLVAHAKRLDESLKAIACQ